MIDFEALSRILIYGYGIEGKSSQKFLQQKFPKATIDLFDENIPEHSRTPDFANYDMIVVSPGVPRTKIPKFSRKFCTSNTEIFWYFFGEILRDKIIGVTGSKGKTSTTAFIEHVLKSLHFDVLIGGNIGKPMLDLTEKIFAKKYDWIVLELSSFQLESLQSSPKYAIFTAFFPDHLDRHGNIKNYFEAKSHLWSYQKSSDFLIISDGIRQEEILSQIQTRGQKIMASLFNVDKKQDEVYQMPIFRENFGTVISLLKVLKIKNASSVIANSLQNFSIPSHRMEKIKNNWGFDVYDNSISSSPGGTESIIDFFGHRLSTLLLGGTHTRNSEESDDDFNFTRLTQIIAKKSPNLQVVVYESVLAQKIIESLKSAGVQNIHKTKNLASAFELARKLTPPKGICLFSPSAKSFDQFKNFTQRGEVFKKIVQGKI